MTRFESNRPETINVQIQNNEIKNFKTIYLNGQTEGFESMNKYENYTSRAVELAKTYKRDIEVRFMPHSNQAFVIFEMKKGGIKLLKNCFENC